MFVMKRIVPLSLILFLFSIALNGQEYTRAIGVRGAFGYDHYQYAGAEFSFQRDVREIGRAEYDIGWYSSTQWDAYKFTGIRQWKIVNKTKFHFYGGAGGGFGLVVFPHAENDFFSWILDSSMLSATQQLLIGLMQHLTVYDLNQIDEDLLKELYQGLVDPDTRHDLGEFYTPDWLA